MKRKERDRCGWRGRGGGVGRGRGNYGKLAGGGRQGEGMG